MCCLFGLYDYGGTLSAKQKNRMIAALAAASEVRGIDATGIAYCMNGHLSVYKRPLPAHWMRFRIPEQAAAVMGHTRMTTQGSEYRNYNKNSRLPFQEFPCKANLQQYPIPLTYKEKVQKIYSNPTLL